MLLQVNVRSSQRRESYSPAVNQRCSWVPWVEVHLLAPTDGTFKDSMQRSCMCKGQREWPCDATQQEQQFTRVCIPQPRRVKKVIDRLCWLYSIEEMFAFTLTRRWVCLQFVVFCWIYALGTKQNRKPVCRSTERLALYVHQEQAWTNTEVILRHFRENYLQPQPGCQLVFSSSTATIIAPQHRHYLLTSN